MMKHLFSINAEGGPLLLVDASVARQWKGVQDAGEDYERLCRIMESTKSNTGVHVRVDSLEGLGWEMSGPGTADIFKDDSGKIKIVRSWLVDNSFASVAEFAEAKGSSPTSLLTVSVPSRELSIMWAAESGNGIPSEWAGEFLRVSSDTAIDGSVYLLRVSATQFDCTHDEIQTEKGQARRLTLTPQLTYKSNPQSTNASLL